MRAACGVAEMAVLPVDVLMNWAPASMARRLAPAITLSSARLPVSRITFNSLPFVISPATAAIMSRASVASPRR